MKNHSTKKIVLYSLLIFALIGLIYSLTTPPVYSSTSQIALFRLKVEDPDNSSEESRNRWIWIRDGLGLKSAIVTDYIIEKIAQSDETARELSSNFPNKHLYYEHLKKFINVQFTGADENNFIVEVKAPSAKLALDLNTLVFERIKYLATKADQQNFEELVTEIKKKQKEQTKDNTTFSFYQDKIMKMSFEQILTQKQKEQAIHIISSPKINNQAIWPKHKLIIAIFAFIGIVTGLAVDFVLKNVQREN